MITLDKAIEIATNYSNEFHPCTDFDYVQAIKLLIEAGELIQAYRKWLETNLCCGLPGEAPKIDSKRSLHHIKENLQGIGEHP